MHFSPADGRAGQAAGFVEPAAPQPLVETVACGFVGGLHVTDASGISMFMGLDRYNSRMNAMKEFRERLLADTQALDSAGLLKRERLIRSAQGPVVTLIDGSEMINLCANNYLGLANHPGVVAAAHAALDRHGYGVASVRFICGTQDIHRELEARLSS
jgi:hypothetical protein